MAPSNIKWRIKISNKMNKSLLSLGSCAGLGLLIMLSTTRAGGGGSADAARQERQHLEDSAYEAYWRGIESKRAGDYVQAGAEFRNALDVLPSQDSTEKYRKVIAKEFSEVCVKLAHQRAVEGSLRDANRYVDVALEYTPDSSEALAMKKKLSDQEWYNPANTTSHIRNIDKVNQGLREAETQRRSGKLDAAEEGMYEVLRTDRYNSAARDGVARVERDRSDYLQAAHDHARAEMFAELDSKWATPLPPRRTLSGAGAGTGAAVGGDMRHDIQRKLNSIIIDQFVLTEATLESAIGALKLRAAELDSDKQGINFVILPGGEHLTRPISLNLQATPLRQVLQYLCDFVGARYVVDAEAVRIVGVGESGPAGEDIISRRYKVPPSFEKIAAAPASQAAPQNPFATDGAAAARSTLSAEEILKSQGIKFDAGARAFYIKGSNTLNVTNTRSQLELVEAFVNSIEDDAPKQVEIQSRFAEIRQENTEELGFDWMLGGFGLGDGDRMIGGGGTFGNSKADTTGQFPFLTNVPAAGGGAPTQAPLGINPVTAGNRSGQQVIAGNAIDSLLKGIDRSKVSVLTPAPGVFSVAGILTDPQFQMVMRGLSQNKATDLLAAPMIVTKGGSRAKIEVIRELLYPTEFDPPELPQQVAAEGAGIPVTPAHPTTFTKKDTGVVMEVEPGIGPDGYQIDLNIAPQVVEFEGFVNYGSPISVSGTDALGNPLTLLITQNRIDLPVFASRRANTNVTIYDGHTVMIGGLAREDVQHGTDKVPIVGDLPFVGRFFRSESEQRLKRNLMIFVRVRLLDPTGQAVREQRASAAADLPTIE